MSKTTLFIPTEGPCAGHPCDNCRTCRSGRCCRRDNPDYKLPELGDWDGPIYGELGVLADDGDKAMCHICGDYFHHLGNHVSRSHDVTPAEYRSIFGFARSFGLAGPSYKLLGRQLCMERPGAMERIAEIGRRHTASLTIEQRSHQSQKPRRLAAVKATADGIRKFHETNLNRRSKLTEDQILAIRSIDPRPSTVDQFTDLAEQYGVSVSTISRVVYRQSQKRFEPDQPGRPSIVRGRSITPSDIADILSRSRSGEAQWRIAKDYGVSQATICLIVNGKQEAAA